MLAERDANIREHCTICNLTQIGKSPYCDRCYTPVTRAHTAELQFISYRMQRAVADLKDPFDKRRNQATLSILCKLRSTQHPILILVELEVFRVQEVSVFEGEPIAAQLLSVSAP